MHRRTIEKTNSILYDFCKRIGVEYVFGTVEYYLHICLCFSGTKIQLFPEKNETRLIFR